MGLRRGRQYFLVYWPLLKGFALSGNGGSKISCILHYATARLNSRSPVLVSNHYALCPFGLLREPFHSNKLALRHCAVYEKQRRGRVSRRRVPEGAPPNKSLGACFDRRRLLYRSANRRSLPPVPEAVGIVRGTGHSALTAIYRNYDVPTHLVECSTL